jgi:hypothetical protein
VELDVNPPVAADVEQALQAALAEERETAHPADSAWRRAALSEAVDRDGDDGYALSPRNTRGATRA